MILLKSNSFGQTNLAPNGNFENMVSCPQMPVVISNYLQDWYSPTNCSPDYYNSCSSVFPTPDPTPGHQVPKSGNGYVGVFIEQFSPPTITVAREYIQAKLIDSLKNGRPYCVSFYVSVPDRNKYTCSSIGAYLGDPITNSGSCQNLNGYSGQIQNPLGNQILDTVNWTKIGGVYYSIGGEQYITIGNFSPTITDTLNFNPTSSASGVYVYFYIEDVSVIEILDAKAGNDTLINTAGTVQLGSNTDTSAFYEWWPHTGIADTNAMNPSANVTQTITYYVRKTQCGVVSVDTVLITVSPIGLTEIDYKEEFVLSPNPNYGSFALQSKSGKAFSGFVQLYDICGKLVYEELIENQNKFTIQSKEISPGVYFVKLADKNRRVVFVSKTIVQ